MMAIQTVATLGVLTGAILLVAAALKLGFLADFISLPVLAGFKAGTGLLIISGQLGKVLGIEQSGDNFFQKTWSAITHVPDANGRTVLLPGPAGFGAPGPGAPRGAPAGGSRDRVDVVRRVDRGGTRLRPA